MRAVVLVEEKPEKCLSLLGKRSSYPLMPVAGRPIIQHISESLIQNGVTSIDWVMSHGSESLIQFLGDGRRWGSVFRLHQTASKAMVPLIVQKLIRQTDTDTSVIVGHADRIPFLEGYTPDSQSDYRTTLAQESFQCTGWVKIQCTVANQEEQNLGSHPEVFAYLGNQSRYKFLSSADIRTPEAYLATCHRLTTTQFSPRARIHPTARIVGPVFIGPGVEICAHVTVGPYVTLNTGCLVDRGSSLSHTVVMPNTYIGERSYLTSTIIDQDRVLAFSDGKLIEVANPTAVAPLTDESTKHFRSVVSGAVQAVSRLKQLAMRRLIPSAVLSKKSAKHSDDQIHPVGAGALAVD